MAVYVGQKDGDFKRILVPVMYFNHPLFGELLREAENEFGSVIPAGSPFVAGSRSLSGSRPGSSKHSATPWAMAAERTIKYGSSAVSITMHICIFNSLLTLGGSYRRLNGASASDPVLNGAHKPNFFHCKTNALGE
nr:auxin-responsive protein SAUR36-like [Ipomoea batatas]